MNEIELFGFQPILSQKIPLYSMSVSAGFPIPAESDIESELDLNEFLIEHPASTFFAHVRGNSFENAGIKDGDILIVDSSISPSDGKFAAVTVNNELSIKIFREVDGESFVVAHDNRFLPLHIEDLEFKIIGTVTKIIHSL